MKQERYSFLLKSCVWEITLACPFSCKYCGSNAGKARHDELTTEECVDIAHQLADLGCRRVSLIGGEVFMRSDWPIIVKTLSDRGIKVCIITNGFLFSEKIISELKNVNVESVAVSLDGPEYIHDHFRQKGSFHRAMQAMDTLAQHNIPVSVISTLSPQNVHHLGELYQILKEKCIFAWQLQACSPMGNASAETFPTEIDFSEVIRFVEMHIENGSFSIGVADNIGYFSESEGYIRGNTSGKAFFRGCQAGLTTIGIDSIGNVRGCESMYDTLFIEGNLRERTLSEIWNNPDAFAYNRQFTKAWLTGKCRTCDYGARCAGGCRSYNYFTHGKMYESLYCAKNQQA